MAEQNNNVSGRPATYYKQRKQNMLKYVPPNAKRTLELGCAEGNFSELVKTSFGAECWGIEINPEVAQVAAAKLDRVINGDASGCLHEVPDNYFDCVICNDVLEHLADPYTLLVSLKEKLTAEGVVVASFPNVRYCRNLFELVVRGNWDYKDDGILDRTHLRFFTCKSLVKMFPQLGYELLTIEGLQSEHNIKTAAVRILTLLFFNIFEDIRYDHFACVARPVS
ncbi:MAG TPA: class I SAM-dependent methyltransferase [Sedimentisphaerales bacterium]|nr:class I SAM-dependent methyltransferase [Sedimentisphaerales bacterium]